MQRLGMALAVLCATALLATAAWSVDLPFYNQSFEEYEMMEGYDFGEPGYDYSGEMYPWPVGWTWNIYTPLIQSLEYAGAPDGDRVLLLQHPVPSGTYHYTAGIWDQTDPGGTGIPYKVVPDATYTFSVKCSKAPGLENYSGKFAIWIGAKGTWDNAPQGQGIEILIPQQTQDDVWTTYSKTWTASAANNMQHTWGQYISLAYCYVYGPAGSPIGLYYDDVRIDGPTSRGVLGTVTLSDWTPADPDLSLTPVKIELIPQGSGVAKTEIVALESDGTYYVPSEAGTYDVVFTAAKFLKKIVPGVVVEEGYLGTQVDVTLTNGDVNGDNHIGTPDFSILSGSFGQTGD